MKNILFLICLFTVGLVHGQEQKVETSKQFQDTLNKEYADAKESPLTSEDLSKFKGLDFFPIDTNYIVRATFVRTKRERKFQMKTSTDRLPVYIKYGELHFRLNNQELKLNVYQSIDLSKKVGFEDYLFLPFSDLTNGKETYIGGRYMDLRMQKEALWTIDFNKAYNPYCAYNHKYSCPKVPLENDLPVAILAGVKKFHD